MADRFFSASVSGKYAKIVWGLLLPFVLGGAMAFVLNVPMAFIERHVFGKAKEKEDRRGRAAAKFARPVSLIFSIVLVVLAILVVVLIVAPELGRTLVNVVKKVEEDIPLVQKWLTDTFQSDSEIVKWASTIEIDPQKIIDSIVSVLRSGADNLVSSTITVTMGLVSMAMNFAIGFVFSCYVLLQKEKLGRQVLKAAYAILPVKTVEYLGHVCTLASKVFSSFITGQCIEAVILGSMFFVSMTIGRFPCNADRSADQFYGADSCVWRNYWMLGGIFLDFDGKSSESFGISYIVLDPAAD